MYEEVKYRVDNKIGAIENEKYRLAFAELPPWHSLGFFDQLAERGWNFVIESWAYHPPQPIDLIMPLRLESIWDILLIPTWSMPGITSVTGHFYILSLPAVRRLTIYTWFRTDC